MAGISVKVKVTAAVTVFTVLLTSIVLAVTLATVVDQDTKNAQSNLRACNENVSSELEIIDGVVIADDSVFVENATYSAVYDTSGHFLCGYMPSAELDDVPANYGEIQLSGTWMVYDAQYKLKKYGDVRVRSVTDTQDAAELFGRLRMLVIAAIAVIAIFAALGTAVIMRRSLRPLDTINKTAATISSGTDLSRRIETRGSKDEFYRLGNTFNNMFDRLERSFEKEHRFSSNASHELRTPAAVILSEAEYALDGDCSAQEQREALEKIRSQASLMSGLTSQLLLISRAERGDWSLKREEVDFSELVEMVGETGREVALKRSIEVRTQVSQGICVSGDPDLLMRMVLNLIENAVKYGKENGCIEMTLTSKGGFACGEVVDDGMGIAEEDLPFIWDRFYQADSPHGGVDKGSGLGLSMVKFVAEAHGGEVS